MPVPAVLMARIQALLDAAFDSKTAALAEKRAGQKIDATERFDVGGRVVKVRVQANDPDFPKEVVLRIKFKPLPEDARADDTKN